MRLPSRLTALAASLLLPGLLAQAALAAPKTLHLMTPLWNPDLQAWLEKTLIPQFEKSHPGYQVDLELTNWGVYTNELTVGFASGNAPDLFLVAGEQVPLVAANHTALPLDPFVQKWGQQADYIPAVWQSDTWRGQVYALPLTVFVPTLILRTDLAREAGLGPASPPATWSQLADWAKRLTRREADKLTRVGWRDPATAQPFMDFVVQNGGAPLSDDGSQVNRRTARRRNAAVVARPLEANQRRPAGTGRHGRLGGVGFGRESADLR